MTYARHAITVPVTPVSRGVRQVIAAVISRRRGGWPVPVLNRQHMWARHRRAPQVGYLGV